MIDNVDKKFCLDEYNIKGERNRKNTCIKEYNCGGYALGIFSWLFPCDTDEEREDWFIFEGKAEGEYDYNISVELGANWMLNNIPNLRKIDSPNDKLEEGEWLVGFKVGIGSGHGDFHYIRRAGNGHFWHKVGPLKIERMSKKEALSDSWCEDKYTSKTIWFAKS